MADQRSPQFIQKTLSWLMPVLRFFFRCEVYGMEKLPKDKLPSVCVANHNIGVLVEGFSLLSAWQNIFKESKICYALAHRFFFNFPGISYVMNKVGCIPATHSAADQVIASGHSVLIFPGGNYEAIRTYSQRERCDFHQRKGWVRIALKHNASVVPISIVGSHSVNPVFYRSQILSYLLILPILFRIKWFPISLAQLVYPLVLFLVMKWLLAPMGLVIFCCYFMYMFAFLIPILPARIRAQVHDPIDLNSLNKTGKPLVSLQEDAEFLQICYNHVTEAIQQTMDKMNGKAT